MNNHRMIEDDDGPAIQELHKISLLLDSDPDLIESMSWDELQTEILEEGLNIDKPLLLYTKPPVEACSSDSIAPFWPSGVAPRVFISSLTTWPITQDRIEESTRIHGPFGKSKFDGRYLGLNSPGALKSATLKHVEGEYRIAFPSNSFDDSSLEETLAVRVPQGTDEAEDLFQDCALKWWKHTRESSIATEVLSEEKKSFEKAQQSFGSLNSLKLHPWIQQMVDRTCQRAALQFRLEQEDLAEFLIEKLRTELHNIRYLKHRSFSTALEAWSRTVIKRYCMNQVRHSAVVKKYAEVVEHINRVGKRNSVSVKTSVVPTPEDELIEREEKQKWAFRALEIHDRVRRIITQDVTIEDLIIAQRWGEGQTLKQIADETHESIKTVALKLSKIQKTVLKAIAIEETGENRDLINEGLRELFANSLQPPF